MAPAAQLTLAHHVALVKVAGRYSSKSEGSVSSDELSPRTLSACIDLVGLGLITEFFGKDGAARFCLPSSASTPSEAKDLLPGLTRR